MQKRLLEAELHNSLDLGSSHSLYFLGKKAWGKIMYFRDMFFALRSIVTDS